MSVRLRVGTPGDIRIGLVGISDKAYIKPDTNSGFPTTSGSNDMYEIVVGASNVGDIDATYKMFTGYFKGLSATPLTQSFPSPDPNTPYALLDDSAHEKTTTDVAMAIKCISGDYYIDSLELFDVENTIADIPEGASVLSTISDITDDGHLTPVEKRWLKPQYDAIVAEYSGIYDQAVALTIDTAAYTAAYTALTTEITEGNYLALGSYFTAMTTTATFKDGFTGGVTYAVAFRTLQSDYWDERSAIDLLRQEGLLFKEIRLSKFPEFIAISARGAVQTEQIVFTAELQNLAIPAGGLVWVTSQPGLTLTAIDEYSISIDAEDVTVDSLTVQVSDGTYIAHVTIVKVADGPPVPYNFGGVTVVPTETPLGEPLVLGDYFLWADENVATHEDVIPEPGKDALTKGEIYEYNGTAWVKSANAIWLTCLTALRPC